MTRMETLRVRDVQARPVDGAIAAPERPGFGLTWDEAAVRRYAAP